MGLHQDKSLYSFSPFVAEMRTRLWSYFLVLDQPGYNAEGSESLFDMKPWNSPSLNVNDHDWPAHRFVKADQVPSEARGYTDMTFALIRRELYSLSRELRNMGRSVELCGRMAKINEVESRIRENYIDHMDYCDPMQRAIRLYTQRYIEEVRLQSEFSRPKQAPSPSRGGSVKYGLAELETTYGPLSEIKRLTFRTRALRTIEMFEKLESLDELLKENQWEWMLRWPLPWHAIGRLLTQLAELPAYTDADRAWRQVDVIFRRHNNEDFNMAKVPAWRVVERLCDQAMLVHSSRMHIGYSYAERPSAGAMTAIETYTPNPFHASSEMAEALFADIDMVNQSSEEGGHMSSW